jgi:hypothetical protein
MFIARRIALAILVAASPVAATETLIDFSDGLFPNGEGPVTYQGVTFTNNGDGAGGPGMLGTTDWGFYFTNAPGASLGLAFNDEWGNTDLRLDFPEGTTKVEMLVSTGPQTLYAADFYGPGDVFLFTVEASMPGDEQAGIIGGEDFRLIAYVRVYEPNGDNFNITLIDDIRYSDEGGEDCYPDFTGDGLLDLFDFLQFINEFDQGTDRVDCDESGALDFFDFLCFTNAFNEGC